VITLTPQRHERFVFNTLRLYYIRKKGFHMNEEIIPYEESELYKIRHSTAHVMAQAVMELFEPGEVKFAIGPPIANGFYYDFELPRQLTPEDFKDVQKRMRKIMAGKHVFEKRIVSAEEAKIEFKDQPFKLELIEGLEDGGVDENGNPIKETPEISFYTHDTFTDLCRGPHVEDTGKLNPSAFSLLSIAGAYWRGDEKGPQLQRVYGTAFKSKEALKEYKWQLEEAKKRDHRKLGKTLGLFHFSEDIGPGIPLFTPKGETIRHLMETYVRDTQTKYGYQHVWTGHIVKEDLYKKSGHYDNYKDSMFPPMVDDNVAFRLKPMNCPSHMTLYKEIGKHSYRELPLRFAEFATLYRYEKSGELNGLTRVRSLTQDDCHTFCTPDQIEEEFTLALNLIREVLDRYHFTDYSVDLSLKGDAGKYVDDPEKWEKAENALRAALEKNNVTYREAYGEAAFYGPKADFMAKDVLGRQWQLSTIQVDFIQPERLGLTYVGEDNTEHTPVVIHRAVTGSTERFLGVLIEHYAGAFPVWLAPIQAVMVPIADRHNEYAHQVAKKLKALGYRVDVDDSNNRMGGKIRTAQKQKVPYMLVVGDEEMESDQIAVRNRNGENPGAMSINDFVKIIGDDVDAGI
jgi:threonyl-tRNA synthetase